MSGNERRLIRVQTVMAVVMVVCSAALIPVWGILGAAVAAAVTNVGVNVWNLFEVRKTLGIFPYNRGYLRLLPPTLVTLGIILVLNKYDFVFRHNWLAIGVTLAAAYGMFACVLLLVGLQADDRLIASAIWSRMRGIFIRAGVAA